MKKIDEVVFTKCSKTIMEQMKVHKAETKFAAILAYYFKPNEDHGLGSLFLNALLKRLNVDKDFLFDNKDINVVLEKPTAQNKGRIDILISSKDFVICIEFKIDHKLNNDLSNYVNFVENNFKEHKKHYVILTPYRKDAEDKAIGNTDFEVVILRDLFNEIEKLKGSVKNNGKLQFYDDLVQTVKNRAIRSSRLNALKSISEKLQPFVKNEFHNNNQGGFLEMKNNKEIFKLRIKEDGFSFEKWENNKLSSPLAFELKKELEIEKIVNEVKRLLRN